MGSKIDGFDSPVRLPGERITAVPPQWRSTNARKLAGWPPSGGFFFFFRLQRRFRRPERSGQNRSTPGSSSCGTRPDRGEVEDTVVFQDRAVRATATWSSRWSNNTRSSPKRSRSASTGIQRTCQGASTTTLESRRAAARHRDRERRQALGAVPRRPSRSASSLADDYVTSKFDNVRLRTSRSSSRSSTTTSPSGSRALFEAGRKAPTPSRGGQPSGRPRSTRSSPSARDRPERLGTRVEATRNART